MRYFSCRGLVYRWIPAFFLSVSSLLAYDDFFALPSPSEILSEAESEGLVVAVKKKHLRVLGLDLEKLSKEKPLESTFAMGRVFSVAGYGLKALNNKIILRLAEKVLGGAKSLDLPEVMAKEIDQYYRLMVTKSKWSRNELMLSFTTARASLMFLLKDSKNIPEKDQPRLDSYGVALECGLWFQSLELAVEELTLEQLEAFATTYLDEDYLDYFGRVISRVSGQNKDFFLPKLELNTLCKKAMEDETLTGKELENIKAKLVEVMQ